MNAYDDEPTPESVTRAGRLSQLPVTTQSVACSREGCDLTNCETAVYRVNDAFVCIRCLISAGMPDPQDKVLCPECSGSVADGSFLHSGQLLCAECYDARIDKPRSPGVLEVRPAYYGEHNLFEPWKVIRGLGMDFFQGNALKYLLRAGRKDSETRDADIDKAITYLLEWKRNGNSHSKGSK